MIFPTEEDLPRNRAALYELLQAARADGQSFRYVNVIRHRLLDAVMRDIEGGTNGDDFR